MAPVKVPAMDLKSEFVRALVMALARLSSDGSDKTKVLVTCDGSYEDCYNVAAVGN